jgi:Fe-S-cluster containining protein
VNVIRALKQERDGMLRSMLSAGIPENVIKEEGSIYDRYNKEISEIARIFGIEAENIRKNFTDFLATAHAHPEGKCAFLDAEGACRIYAARPYVCRTQGLPLMIHLEEDGRELELIDICELNEPTLSLDELADEDFFFTNPWEEKLAILQMQADKGKMDRMKLRDLFEPSRRHGL